MEARLHERGARVERAQVEERVRVGCEEGGEVAKGFEVGRRHGRRMGVV